MNNGIKGVWRHLVSAARRESPKLLTGLGIGGMTASTILAVKATPEAMRRINAKRRELRRKLTPKETVQAAWRCYIWSGVTWGASCGCLIASLAVNDRRNAALAAAASIANEGLAEYRSKVVETIGKKKESAILDSIDRDRVERNPPPKQLEAPPETGGPEPVLCYDAMLGNYFYSDIETLRRAANELNYRMNNMSEPYVSLNEFYEEIGLPSIDIGEELGWRNDHGMIELRFSSQLINGRPVLVVSHLNPPEYDYNKV